MKRVLCLTLLVALVAVPSLADGPETGVVSGVVTDAGGSPLPGVGVTLTGPIGEKFMQTEANGSYRFALLRPGDYTLKAQLEGMGEGQGVVTIAAGKRNEVNLKLTMATAETITVTSEAPLVDKFNVSAGQTMQSEVGTEVTGETRDFYGVINFMPGVTNDDENADLASHRPNINGATWADSNVYIDGVDTTFARYGGTRVYIPTAATTEVTLESGGLSADYGRTVGSATNVIVKSGTNQFHGDFGTSLAKESWNAEFKDHPEMEIRQTNQRPRDFFKRTAEEKDADESSYETGFGGPMKRDKAWFFVSVNRQRGNRVGKTINGDLVDESGDYRSRIVKLNFQPGASHQLAVSYMDTPLLRNFRLEVVFDKYAMTPHDISGDLISTAYNWSVSNNLFFEAKLAAQTSNENKLLAFGGTDIDAAIAFKQMDPRFPAASPALVGGNYPGNNFRPYIDQDGWHNGWLLDNGYGTNEFPRKQVNAAFTHFVNDNNELKYGIDAQEVEWLGNVKRENLYSAGAGIGNQRFSATNPLGYATSATAINPTGAPCNYAVGEFCILQDYNTADLLADLGSNDTVSQNVALYFRDRLTVGDKWVFNVGLRLENQNHENDIGREVMDSTDLSPRFNMAYDIQGDGKQLITLFVGRSFHQLPQQAINEYMEDQFNGYNGFTRYLWIDCVNTPSVCGGFGGVPLPVPVLEGFGLGYVSNRGNIIPGLQWDLVDAGDMDSPNLEAYHKDEIIAGYEWQFSDNWALDVKALWWQVDNLISSTQQIAELADGSFDVFTFSANTSQVQKLLTQLYNSSSPAAQALMAGPAQIAGYIEPNRYYKALQVQLNRRFADGWGLYSNVTWGEAAGSSHGSVFNNTNDSYGENLFQLMTQADIDNCQAQQVSRNYPVDCAAGWGPHIGQPLSVINRDGRADFDRTIIAKTSGWKVFDITAKQAFTLGGHLTYQTGKPWARSESTGSAIALGQLTPAGFGVSVPIEKPGSREMSAHWWLNLSGAYNFPIGNKVSAEVRAEIQNVTDNQEAVGISSRGEVRVVRRGYQRPRRFRLLGSIKF